MTSTQVFKYAEYLGVNLDQYPELYPLMEQGLRAPLPAGWEIISEGNSHYFLNNVTGTMQKDHPADDLYRQAARRQMNDLGPRSPAGRAGLARSPSNAFTPSRSRELDAPQPNSSSSSSSTSERTERGRAIRYMCFGFLLAVLLHATIALALFHAYSSEGLPPIFSALWSPAAPSVAPQPAADAVATPAAAAAPASSAAATPTSRGAKAPVEAKEEPAEEEEEAGSWW